MKNNRHSTAEQIRKATADRILSGTCARGDPLPSVRELAQELGANPNTVNKAYQALRDAGMIELSPNGRSFIVCTVPRSPGALIHVRDKLREVIWQAKASGVSRQQLVLDFDELLASLYDSEASDVRVLFLECNASDARLFSARLSELTGVEIECELLGPAIADVAGIARRFDLIVTPFNHLAEVNRAFGAHHAKIVGVDARIAPNSLIEITRLSKNHVGLVCGEETTLYMLRLTIASYHAKFVLDPVLIGNADGVRAVAKNNDHVVVTHTCAEPFTKLTRRQPDIVVHFTLDEQSVKYLHMRIQEVRQAKMMHLNRPRLPLTPSKRGVR